MTDTPPRILSRFTEETTADEVLAGIDLAGRTAIVTGGASGVGLGTARALARAGADVTLAVRDIAMGDAASRAIGDALGIAAPTVAHLDLLSLASVRAFAGRWGDRPIKILVNNAGILGAPFALTEDGFESQMAVNYFGQFLITTLLAPNLIAGAPARVVVVSAGAHCDSTLDPDDLNYTRRPYDPFVGYGASKRAANLFTAGFNRRYAARGVTANAVTPGGVLTNIGRHVTFQDAVDRGWANADGTLPDGIMKTIDQGAATSVWAATAPELEGIGGLYLEDCQQAEVRTPLRPIKGYDPHSFDPAEADRLWDVATRLTGAPITSPPGVA